jgi:hypothetical protein
MTTGHPLDAVLGGTDQQIYRIVGGRSAIDPLRPVMNGTTVLNPNSAGVGNVPIIWTIK